MINTFNYTLKDAQALPVTPIDPQQFDLARYAAYAAEADQRYADFLSKPSGLAVWQRVRVGEVFRDACRDMRQSLRLQLGGLLKSLDYATDAPTYLEPWYGIGTTASAFGGEYDWFEGQAPAVRPLYKSIDEVPPLVPRDFAEVPIMRYTLDTIEYFLDQTQGRIPISWSDLQAPLNVATELIDTSAFFTGMIDQADRVREILSAITEVVIRFTQQQSELIGDQLARPGHGFASSRVRHRHRPEHRQSGDDLAQDVRQVLRRRQHQDWRGVRRRGDPLVRRLRALASGVEEDQ